MSNVVIGPVGAGGGATTIDSLSDVNCPATPEDSSQLIYNSTDGEWQCLEPRIFIADIQGVYNSFDNVNFSSIELNKGGWTTVAGNGVALPSPGWYKVDICLVIPAGPSSIRFNIQPRFTAGATVNGAKTFYVNRDIPDVSFPYSLHFSALLDAGSSNVFRIRMSNVTGTASFAAGSTVTLQYICSI